MPDPVVELGKIDWKRVFPWVRLFRVFRTAIDLRMLCLSCVALVALSVGDWIFSNLPFAASERGVPESHAAYHWDRPAAENPIDFPVKVANHPWEVLTGIGSRWERLLQPVRTVLEPARTILRPAGNLEPEGVGVDAAIVGFVCLVGAGWRDDPHRRRRASD